MAHGRRVLSVLDSILIALHCLTPFSTGGGANTSDCLSCDNRPADRSASIRVTSGRSSFADYIKQPNTVPTIQEESIIKTVEHFPVT